MRLLTIRTGPFVGYLVGGNPDNLADGCSHYSHGTEL